MNILLNWLQPNSIFKQFLNGFFKEKGNWVILWIEYSARPLLLSILDTFLIWLLSMIHWLLTWIIFWIESPDFNLNWITRVDFELNNSLTWILGKQYWIEYWIESERVSPTPISRWSYWRWSFTMVPRQVRQPTRSVPPSHHLPLPSHSHKVSSFFPLRILFNFPIISSPWWKPSHSHKVSRILLNMRLTTSPSYHHLNYYKHAK